MNHSGSETHHDGVRSTAVDGNTIAARLDDIIRQLNDLPVCYTTFTMWRSSDADRAVIDDATTRCLFEPSRAYSAAKRIGGERIGGAA